jgi:hypothetical protein
MAVRSFGISRPITRINYLIIRNKGNSPSGEEIEAVKNPLLPPLRFEALRIPRVFLTQSARFEKMHTEFHTTY